MGRCRRGCARGGARVGAFSAFRGGRLDFDFMDRDKGGHVTLAEFVAWVNAAEAVAAEAQGPAGRAPPPAPRRPRRAGAAPVPHSRSRS